MHGQGCWAAEKSTVATVAPHLRCLMYLTIRKKCSFHYSMKPWERIPLCWLTDWMPRCLADGESPDWQLAYWMHVRLGGWLFLLSSRLGNWLYGCLAGLLTHLLTKPQNTYTSHLTFFLLFYAVCLPQLPRVLLLMSTLKRCCSRYIHSVPYTLIHQYQWFPCCCLL